jgi:hypothetical protein
MCLGGFLHTHIGFVQNSPFNKQPAAKTSNVTQIYTLYLLRLLHPVGLLSALVGSIRHSLLGEMFLVVLATQLSTMLVLSLMSIGSEKVSDDHPVEAPHDEISHCKVCRINHRTKPWRYICA